MGSLQREVALRKRAEQARATAKAAQRLARTGQIERSTVEVGEDTVDVAELLTTQPDPTDVDYDGLGLTEFDQSQDAEDAAHEAHMEAIGSNARALEAIAEAAEAADTAASALTTSNGKNARRRGVTQPDPPEGGWVQGDQWVRDVLVEGVTKPVEVLVWNGAEFVHETLLTGEVLVLGAGGVIRLADGTVTARNLVADAIDGMIITGAIIRTAATGRRLVMDESGLKAYNALGVLVATVSPDANGIQIENPYGGKFVAGVSETSSTIAKVTSEYANAEMNAYGSNSGVHFNVLGDTLSLTASPDTPAAGGTPMRLASNRGLVFAVPALRSSRSLKTLWEGAVFMNSTQTAPLNDLVENQANGIILEWSDYTDGAATNTYWNFTHVHKSAVSRGTFSCPIENALGATNKLVSLSGTVLNGHAANINGNRTRTVLRRILGY